MNIRKWALYFPQGGRFIHKVGEWDTGVYHKTPLGNHCLYTASSTFLGITMRCRYNAVNFIKKKYSSNRASYGVSFVGLAFDWYYASVFALMYAISCYNGPRYNGTRLYFEVWIPKRQLVDHLKIKRLRGKSRKNCQCKLKCLYMLISHRNLMYRTAVWQLLRSESCGKTLRGNTTFQVM